MATKINNYLTIDVSGTTPINNLIPTIGSTSNRDGQIASRIPRQKVLNIKLKEN
jgi:hypothetical protein